MRERRMGPIDDADGWFGGAAGLAVATARAIPVNGDLVPPVSRLPRRPFQSTEQLVQWCLGRYPQRRYRAVVLSEPHGSAAHLAAALGVPWLPVAGTQPLSPVYRHVIEAGLEPGAPIFILAAGARSSDARRGMVPSLAYHAARRGHQPYVVRLPSDALSAAVAQLYRTWLRGSGKQGDQLIVECGRLLDPWHVLRAGLVPYWCPSARPRHAEQFTWWLAGEQRYSSVEVLLQPPGPPALPGEVEAWQCAAGFASRRGVVESGCLRAYPGRPLSGRHATRVLCQYPSDLPLPAPLTIDAAVAALTAPLGVLRG
jgi:hypothetical protein